jgi:hypothetical protein
VASSHSLKVFSRHLTKSKEHLLCKWMVFGSPKNHNSFVQDVLADKDVIELEY